MLPPGASGSLRVARMPSGSKCHPTGDQYEMLNGDVEPEGTDHIMNGVSRMRLRFS